MSDCDNAIAFDDSIPNMDPDIQEQLLLDKDFSYNSIRQITGEAVDKYIKETYSTILLQILIAAENRRYTTSFAANEAPMELVTWLLIKGFILFWGDKNGKRYRITMPSDYPEDKAVTLTVTW